MKGCYYLILSLLKACPWENIHIILIITYHHYSGNIIDERSKMRDILNTVKGLQHQNILTCLHYIMKEKELVIITELITAGSIRE